MTYTVLAYLHPDIIPHAHPHGLQMPVGVVILAVLAVAAGYWMGKRGSTENQ